MLIFLKIWEKICNDISFLNFSFGMANRFLTNIYYLKKGHYLEACISHEKHRFFFLKQQKIITPANRELLWKESMSPWEFQTNSSIVEVFLYKTSLLRHTRMESNSILYSWYCSAALGTKSFLWNFHIFVVWLLAFLFKESWTERPMHKLEASLYPPGLQLKCKAGPLSWELFPDHSLEMKRKSYVFPFIIKPQPLDPPCFPHPPLLKLIFPTVSSI